MHCNWGLLSQTNKSVMSYLHTLTKWHCPHSRAATAATDWYFLSTAAGGLSWDRQTLYSFIQPALQGVATDAAVTIDSMLAQCPQNIYSSHHTANVYFVHKTESHPFNGPLSGTTRVSRYQKGKTNLDFTEASNSEWQWHQLGHMQVCILLQTDNHTSTPLLCFFTGRMPFLPPNQQCQSTEGKNTITIWLLNG